MSVGSGLVQESTHLEIGDYRLVKTLGVGAFGKVKRESPALSVPGEHCCSGCMMCAESFSAVFVVGVFLLRSLCVRKKAGP